MPYLILFIALLIIEFLYIKVARRLNILAAVAPHSSHTIATPTAGGVIFLISIGCFFAQNYTTLNSIWWYITAGIFALGILSLIDDIKPLSPTLRLVIHAIVVAIALHDLIAPATFHIFLMFLICGVGLINAINFIDGIACMLAFYGLVTLLTLYYGFSLSDQPETANYEELALTVTMAVAAFTVFNIPDKVFAGDVGAITLGFVITFLLFQFMMIERDASSLIFIIVCLCDVGLTTLQRLFEGKNILHSHRSCIYQTLTGVWKIPHLVISTSYALLQASINVGYFVIPANQHWSYVIIITLTLTTFYFIIRHQARKKRKAGKKKAIQR